MTHSFSCKETERIWDGEASLKFPFAIQQTAKRKLVIVDAAISINDLRVPPGNRLEKLKGNLHEYYSLRINNQWRIVFKWRKGHVYEVAIRDYH